MVCRIKWKTNRRLGRWGGWKWLANERTEAVRQWSTMTDVSFIHLLLSGRGISTACPSPESAEQLGLVPISRFDPPSPKVHEGEPPSMLEVPHRGRIVPAS